MFTITTPSLVYSSVYIIKLIKGITILKYYLSTVVKICILVATALSIECIDGALDFYTSFGMCSHIVYLRNKSQCELLTLLVHLEVATSIFLAACPTV